jgi:hypothetical protein
MTGQFRSRPQELDGLANTRAYLQREPYAPRGSGTRAGLMHLAPGGSWRTPYRIRWP